MPKETTNIYKLFSTTKKGISNQTSLSFAKPRKGADVLNTKVIESYLSFFIEKVFCCSFSVNFKFKKVLSLTPFSLLLARGPPSEPLLIPLLATTM